MISKPTYKILIVDDNPEDRITFKSYLSQDDRYNYQILEAELVSEALEICDRTLPNLILLDYLLPDDDGLVFLEEWQKRYGNSPIPIIILTGQGDEKIVIEALKSGAQDYWVKGSLTAANIQQRVYTVLQQFQLKQQNARQQEQQTLVNSIALRIRQSLRLEEVLQRTVEEVRQFLQTDRVLIYKFAPDMSGMIVAESVLPTYTACLNLPIEDVCFREKYVEKYRQGRFFIASDIYKVGIAECHIELLERFQVKANLVVPLLLNSRSTPELIYPISESETQYDLWGLLIAHQCDRPREWQDYDLELLQQLAVQLAIAIQQAEMYERVEAELYARIDAQLRERQRVAAEFRALVENATDIIYRIDRDLRYLYFNPAIEKLVKQPASSLIGKTPHDLGVSVEIIVLWRAVIDRMMVNKVEETIEHPFPNFNSPIWFQIRIVPELNATGDVDTFLCIARDISDRKRNEETLRFQAEILDRIHDAVIVTDLDGKICSWNQGAENLYGYSAAEGIGQSVSILYFPEDLSQIQAEIFQPLLAKRSHEVELRNITKSGKEIYISLRLSLIRDEEGNIINLIGCSNDITDRKKAEQQLQHLNQELEARVEKRTAELQESQRFIQSITDNAPNIIYIYDLQEQRNIYCNREIGSILGYSSEQIQSMGSGFLIDLIHADDLENVFAHFGQLKYLKEGEKRNHEYRMRDVNGQWHWFLSRDAAFLRDRDGKVKQIIGTAQDITERKHIEEQLRKSETNMRMAQRIAGLGSWEFDVETGDLLWSTEIFTIFGRNPTIGTPTYEELQQIIHPEDRAQHDQLIQQAIAQGVSYDIQYRFYRPDGTMRYLQGRGEPIFNAEGQVVQLVGTALDITERRQSEEKLRQVNERLTLSNAELHRATKLKDEFLANMSHELRTPLNSILGMTEGLQDGIFGILTDRQKQAVNSIDRSGNHLLTLINDVLDLAKVESGKLELQLAPTSITYLCRNSLTFVRQQAIKKNIQLTTEIPSNLPDMVVDELRIRQVLINLLNNAVKFTPDGGSVKLVVQPVGTPNESLLHFSVVDTGIGMTQEDVAKLFRPFVQIDSRLNRQYSGTGLGLALVRRLVELHQGKVVVTSELGKGSCFTVSLPYILSEATTVQPSISQPKRIENEQLQPLKQTPNFNISETEASASTILLVEDNEFNIATISSYLGSKGYKLLIAKNGEDGVKLAKSEHPDLILMDIQLPNVNGLEAISQIRAEQELANIPIIALTALAMPGDREKCLVAGANDYMSKPLNLKQLIENMQSLLQKG